MDERPRRDIVMFVTGVVMALSAAVMMFLGEEDTTPFITLGIVGVLFIAVSRRPRSHL